MHCRQQQTATNSNKQQQTAAAAMNIIVRAGEVDSPPKHFGKRLWICAVLNKSCKQILRVRSFDAGII
jgi:hypothetical protein